MQESFSESDAGPRRARCSVRPICKYSLQSIPGPISWNQFPVNRSSGITCRASVDPIAKGDPIHSFDYGILWCTREGASNTLAMIFRCWYCCHKYLTINS